jgi:hypothetical protein
MAPIGACSPDDVLDRDGKSEIRGRQREVPGYRGQEQLEALAHPMPRLRSTAAKVKIGRIWPKLPREIVVLGIAEVPAVRRGNRVRSGDATEAGSSRSVRGYQAPRKLTRYAYSAGIPRRMIQLEEKCPRINHI